MEKGLRTSVESNSFKNKNMYIKQSLKQQAIKNNDNFFSGYTAIVVLWQIVFLWKKYIKTPVIDKKHGKYEFCWIQIYLYKSR